MINSLVLPYTNFKLGDIIDPDEFNSNNSAIISKVNEIVNVINTDSPGGGGDGDDIFLPSYIKETYIDPVEIKSPNITGNSFIGGNGMVGFSSVGTTQSSVRFWAGSTNRDTAPFRVTQGGSVYMTKANIETETVDNKYITMGGSRIDGGTDNGKSYVIGTADYTGASRSGIFQSLGYSSSTSTTVTRTMSVGNNSIMVSGGNLVLGGTTEDRPVVITRRVQIKDITKTIGTGTALYVDGNIETTSIWAKNDVYVGSPSTKGVSGSFTSSDGKTITVTNGIITKIL